MYPNVDLNGYTQVDLLELPISVFVGDLEERWKTIGSFLKTIFSQYQNPKILDMAMGSGQDSIQLLQEGYNVISNEINPVGITDAKKNAETKGVNLIVREIEWSKIKDSKEYKTEEFDMVLSLGNSFPNYVLDHKDRRASIEGVWKILKPGGTFMFDCRNFDYISKNREYILKDPEHNFVYKYSNTYIGKEAIAFPVKITDDQMLLIHKNIERKIFSELHLWLATKERVLSLIKEVAPDSQIQVYYDYQTEPPAHYDFLQYVVKK